MAYDSPRGFTIMGNPADLEIAYFTVLDAEEVFIGDLLVEGGTSGTASRAASGSQALHVGIGLERATGSALTVEIPVCIDPRAKYQIQVSTDQDIAATDIFSYFSVIHGGDPSSGDYSNMELDVQAVNAADPCVVLGIVEGPAPGGGSFATFGSAHAQAIVKLRAVTSLFNGATS